MKIYRAVVVDNNDPSKTGKVQIKILGNHENTDNQKTLPWAEVMLPAPGLIGGIGFSSVIKNGTWVYCIREDESLDKYIILGVCVGVTEDEEIEGFKDPNGKYPLPETKGLSDFGHCSITTDSLHNGAENEETETSKGVGFKYTNTVSPSKYLDSSILRTSSGIMIELDDADEKIKITHPSGSTIEMLADGRIITVAQNEVILNCKNNVTWNILGDWNMNVDGNVKWNILGEWKSCVEKQVTFACHQNVKWGVDKSVSWLVNNSVNWEVKNDVDWKVYNSVSWDILNSVNWIIGNSVGWKVNNNVKWDINSTIDFSTDSGYNVKTPSSISFDSSSFNSKSSSGLLSGVNVITTSGKDLEKHIHGGVKGGSSTTTPPI